MEYKQKGKPTGKSRKILKVVAWGIGATAVIAVGLWGYGLYYESTLTPDDKVFREALLAEKADPVKADKLYAESLKAAALAGVTGDKMLSKILTYGDFLHGRWRYKDAVMVFEQGLKVATIEKDKSWQSTFYQRLATIQYWAIRAGALTKSDPTPGLKAIELDPAMYDKPSAGVARTYIAIGEAYLGLKDYKRADEWLRKAEETFMKLEESTPRKLYGAQVASLIEQGKLKEANESFVKRLSANPNAADRGSLLNAFYEAIAGKNAAARAVDAKTDALLKARDFAGLDAYAAQLLADKAPGNGGIWRIEDFYNKLDELRPFATEEQWKERVQTLQDWTKARPESDTAKIALARVMVSLAWKSRGSGYAHTVTGEGAAEFARRLAEALKILDSVKVPDPVAFTVRQRILMGTSKDAKVRNEVYEQSRKAFPHHDAIVASSVYFAHPNWFGKEGDDKKFLEAEAKKLPGKEGDILYGQTLGRLDRDRLPSVLSQTALTFPQAKAGLQESIKRNPQDLEARATLSSLAVQAKDVETARSAFAGVQP